MGKENSGFSEPAAVGHPQMPGKAFIDIEKVLEWLTHAKASIHHSK